LIVTFPMPEVPLGIAMAQLAAALAVLALLSIPLARSITAPLERLGGQARAFGAGDLSARSGLRSKDEIGVMTLRGGDVIGDHTLVLAGPGERLELTHRSSNRALFARGALRAARWLVGQPPGRYGMKDVLGLA
jgi:4-hydroxy-tetrahydrodipicolinate reductase